MGTCLPIDGDASAPLKIVFININDVAFFDVIVADGIAQFDKFEPFNDPRLRRAIYQIDLHADETDLGCEASGILSCDNSLIDAALATQCGVDDSTGLIKVAIVQSDFTARAGEVIYVGGFPADDEQVALGLLENTIIHEFAHNLGLADLYGGSIYFDGRPSPAWPPEFARRFLNVDGPGCPKWCNGFKPASEYLNSPTAVCATFDTKQACITHNRDATGDCPADGDGNFECCVWDDDQPFEYFGGQCAPHRGTEDIGLDCLAGSGCYFGAALGQYAWRANKLREESLMASQFAPAFSSVELRALNQVIDCCLTATDADPLCADFRKEYADFLHEGNFKHWIGSCAVMPSADDPPIFAE